MTDFLLTLVLPYVLLLARVSAFLVVLPVFSWQSMPMYFKLGLCLVLTLFFASIVPLPPVAWAGVGWIQGGLMLVRELLTGFAIGSAANVVFLAVQQGAKIIAQQMGFTDAETVDPMTGEGSDSMSLLFEMCFAMLFLSAGGHLVMLNLLARSYEVFPVGQGPDAAAMLDAMITAGSAMLLLALKMSAPMLAAFLVLAVVLAVLARVLPEMNILLASFPLRIALGLLVAAAMMPLMTSMTVRVAQHMQQLLPA